MFAFIPLSLTRWGGEYTWHAGDNTGTNAGEVLLDGLSLVIAGLLGLVIAAIARALERRVRRGSLTTD